MNEPPLLCKEQPVGIALLLLDCDDGGTALGGFHLDVVVDFLREGIGIWQLLAVLHVTVENAAGNEAVLIVYHDVIINQQFGKGIGKGLFQRGGILIPEIA